MRLKEKRSRGTAVPHVLPLGVRRYGPRRGRAGWGAVSEGSLI